MTIHLHSRQLLSLCAALILAGSSIQVMAGGVLGDLVNVVVPGAGTTLDQAHDQVKKTIPIYGQAEETVSHTVNEAVVQATAPLLQQAIVSSRDDALSQGVRPIPQEIRHNLTGFISDADMNAARYRVQGGGDLTLQVNSLKYGDANAITLDYVIVFKNENDALYSPNLWAHELTHVGQYRRWGIQDFAIHYVRNYRAVEDEAYGEQSRHVAWVALRNTQNAATNSYNPDAMNRPVATFANTDNSSICGTLVTSCRVNGVAPVGTPCWCNTAMGAATGSLIPDSSGGAHTASLPIPAPTQPMPAPPPANACATNAGSCGLGVGLPIGSQCVCQTPQGNFPGIAQIKNLNNACQTYMGNCPLASPLFSGDPCWCPSNNGPIGGRVP
ncbi:eCIS core domain-containing protein [Pseudomonas sp. HLT2-19-2]